MKKKLVYPQNNRFELTVSSTDCNFIPKVKDAGRVIKGNPKLQLMHNGIKVIANSYVGEWMTEAIRLLKGHHEPQEEKMFHQILDYMPEGGSMIELGSNWAYYSMWFNKKVKHAKNIMVEPSEQALKLGEWHFRLNNMSGIFINGLVGQKYCQKVRHTDYHGKQQTIAQYSVDYLIRKHQLKSLDILHSDIQGAEYDMLKGSAIALKQKRIKFLIVSTHLSKHYLCKHFLKNYGYRIIAEHNIRESSTADGLIVATSLPDVVVDSHFTSLRQLTLRQKLYNFIDEMKAVIHVYLMRQSRL